MNTAIRVAERFLLAPRVAARVKEADTIGDPREFLREYNAKLARYAGSEPAALKLKAQYAAVFKAKAEGAPDETMAALRRAIPGMGPESPVNVTIVWEREGFVALKDPASRFCYAVLQQLALPPKARKSIEAATKFWSKNARFSAKGSLEERYASHIDGYLDHLEVFRKYAKVFEQALKEGKEHSAEGEGATKFTAGPFTLVNTGGFDPKVMQAKAQLAEEAAAKMKAIGLGQVCYGNVLVTNRISSREAVAAFYLPSSDEMFVKADTSVDQDTVRVVCHELTHRYEHKFMGSKVGLIKKLYATINTHSFVRHTEAPKPGEEVTDNNKRLVVKEFDWQRNTVVLTDPADPNPNVVYRMPIETYALRKGDRADTDLTFISHYAKKGGPSENFAEMVSYYAIGKLPKAQVELLLPLL
jgi:hypothetical protein